MPTNKNAQLRYQVLDRCLSNWSRRYYIEDLVEACNEALYQYNGETKDGGGVKKRQVQEDLNGWMIWKNDYIPQANSEKPWIPLLVFNIILT